MTSPSNRRGSGRARARRRAGSPPRSRVPAPGELLDPRDRVERVPAQELARRLDRPARRAGACGTSTAPSAAPAGSRGRSARCAAPNARHARARPAARPRARSRSTSDPEERGAPRPRCGANQSAHVRASSAALSRSSASSRAQRVAEVVLERRRGCSAAVLTRIEQAVERGDVDAGRVEAVSSAWTSVVPEPANGSRTCAPGARTWRSSSASTSCGTYLPRYGWSRWTCFVRTRSGSSAPTTRARGRPRSRCRGLPASEPRGAEFDRTGPRLPR